jgi:uncharacterized protein YggE
MRTSPLLLLAGVPLLLAPGRALGQNAPKGTVAGQGVVDLRRRPTVLRVQVEVVSRGKDLKEALTRLKERREAARTRLLALGAAQEDIVFGEPGLGSNKTPQQARVEAMFLQRMRARGAKAPAKAAAATLAEVSVSLKADLPLKASGPEEVLVRGQELLEKVKAADLGGLKELEKLSPQEEELAEENMAQFGGEEGLKQEEPAFLFVCKISEEEHAKALAEAFQKARREAPQLARAAGAELGALQQLEGTGQSRSAEEVTAAYQTFRMRGGIVQPALPAEAREAAGTQPGTVVYRVAVMAGFALVPRGK